MAYREACVANRRTSICVQRKYQASDSLEALEEGAREAATRRAVGRLNSSLLISVISWTQSSFPTHEFIHLHAI